MTNNVDLYYQRYRNNNYDGQNVLERIQDRVDIFFSKGYNIVRLIFFIVVMIYLLYTFVTAMNSIPEGETLTITHFLSQILKNFNDLRENFPVFEYIYSKISNLISANQVNCLIFLSSMLGTVLVLMCFCP